MLVSEVRERLCVPFELNVMPELKGRERAIEYLKTSSLFDLWEQLKLPTS